MVLKVYLIHFAPTIKLIQLELNNFTALRYMAEVLFT